MVSRCDRSQNLKYDVIEKETSQLVMNIEKIIQSAVVIYALITCLTKQVEREGHHSSSYSDLAV